MSSSLPRRTSARRTSPPIGAQESEEKAREEPDEAPEAAAEQAQPVAPARRFTSKKQTVLSPSQTTLFPRNTESTNDDAVDGNDTKPQEQQLNAVGEPSEKASSSKDDELITQATMPLHQRNASTQAEIDSRGHHTGEGSSRIETKLFSPVQGATGKMPPNTLAQGSTEVNMETNPLLKLADLAMAGVNTPQQQPQAQSDANGMAGSSNPAPPATSKQADDDPQRDVARDALFLLACSPPIALTKDSKRDTGESCREEKASASNTKEAKRLSIQGDPVVKGSTTESATKVKVASGESSLVVEEKKSAAAHSSTKDSEELRDQPSAGEKESAAPQSPAAKDNEGKESSSVEEKKRPSMYSPIHGSGVEEVQGSTNMKEQKRATEHSSTADSDGHTDSTVELKKSVAMHSSAALTGLKDVPARSGATEKKAPTLTGKSAAETDQSKDNGKNLIVADNESTDANTPDLGAEHAVDTGPTKAISQEPTASRPLDSVFFSETPRPEAPGVKESVEHSKQDAEMQVDEVWSSNSRKRPLSDTVGSDTAREGLDLTLAKRQRAESPPLTQSASAEYVAMREEVVERKALPTDVSQGLPSMYPNIENVKIRLYDVASKVHRGRGAERRFANYWDALCRFVGVQFGAGSSNLAGVREALDSFLTTKKMRRLHNLLILGLMERSTKEYAIDKRLVEKVPSTLRERIRTREFDENNIELNADASPVLDTASLQIPGLHEYSQLSDIWSATGREPLFSHSYCTLESASALSIKDVSHMPRHSSCLPGALALDPTVRALVEDESLKVSEPALWLLIVAVREYVGSLLTKTISNIDSVHVKHSLPAWEFSQSAMRSGKMSENPGPGSAKDKKSKAKKEEKQQLVGSKRRCISSLDIAAVLNTTRMGREGSVGGSALRMASEGCYLASFDQSEQFVSPEYDSLQTFITDSIEAASKKQRLEWHDPEPASLVDTKTAASKADSTAPPKTTSSKADSAAPLKTTASKADSPAPPKTTTRRSPSGLGIGAKDLAALKARATAMESEATASSTAGKAAAATTNNKAPGDTVAERARGEKGDNGATGSGSKNEKDKHTSPRPQGGKGIGVKNLAAMRARSVGTPENSDVASSRSTPPPTSRPSSQKQGGSQGDTAQPRANGETSTLSSQTASLAPKEQSAKSTPSPGGGKELRRLQEAEARKHAAAGVSQLTGGAPKPLAVRETGQADARVSHSASGAPRTLVPPPTMQEASKQAAEAAAGVSQSVGGAPKPLVPPQAAQAAQEARKHAAEAAAGVSQSMGGAPKPLVPPPAVQGTGEKPGIIPPPSPPVGVRLTASGDIVHIPRRKEL